MTFILFLLINNEDFPVQFFTLVSGNVPVFQKQLQKFDEFLSLSGVDINDQIHILFHVCSDVSQAPHAVEYPILVGRNFIFDQIDFSGKISGLHAPEIPNHSLQAATR